MDRKLMCGLRPHRRKDVRRLASFFAFQETSFPGKQNPPGDRTAAEWNCVADATRHRRRVSQAKLFYI